MFGDRGAAAKAVFNWEARLTFLRQKKRTDLKKIQPRCRPGPPLPERPSSFRQGQKKTPNLECGKKGLPHVDGWPFPSPPGLLFRD